MRKLLSILLAVAIALTVCVFAVSCGGNVDNPVSSGDTTTTEKKNDQTTTQTSSSTTSSQTTSQTSTPDNPDDISSWDGRTKMPGMLDVDFGGRTFLFASAADDDAGWANATEIWIESLTNDSIDDAVYERNKLMSSLYNCTIAVDDGGWDNGLNADISSGAGKYIGACHEYMGFNTGNFYNVLNLGIDFEQPWWDKAFFRDLECNGKLFGMSGDFGYHQMKATWIMFYNKDVYEQNFDENIYDLVRQKKWTVDKLLEMATKVTSDVNGDQQITYSEDANADIIGMVTTAHNYRGLYNSCGEFYVTHNDNGKMICALTVTGKGSDVIDKIRTLTTVDAYQELPYTQVRPAIENATALFAGECMGALQLMADVEGLRVGVIPLPLYDENQGQYYHYVNNRGTEYGIPTSYKDLDTVRDFYTLFAAHSQKTVRKAFVDTFKYTYASDEESGEMVDLILNTRTYDPGYHIFSAGMDGVLSSMCGKNGQNQFASAAKRYATSTEEQIATFEATVANINNN